MKTAWLSFGLWALVAASAVAWALTLFAGPRPAPPRTVVAAAPAAPRGDLARLLGDDPVAAVEAAAPPNARFHLIGVVAPRPAAAAAEGVALIAVDNKPPKAYRVGAAVDGDLVLQAVRTRGADLGPRGAAANVALEIAPPPPAATGALPVAGAPPGVPPPAPAMAHPQPLNPAARVGALPRPAPPPAADPAQQARPDALQAD